MRDTDKQPEMNVFFKKFHNGSQRLRVDTDEMYPKYWTVIMNGT